jgi:pyruvate kinase
MERSLAVMPSGAEVLGGCQDPGWILTRLVDLARAMVELEARELPVLEAVAPAYRASARNLVHYVALRQHDIRDLQEQLACLGLSSLGRCEPSVLDTLRRVLAILCALTGEERGHRPGPEPPLDHRAGLALAGENARRLLGEAGKIMVTLPAETAEDPTLVVELLEAGMTVARINCAHDDPSVWRRMVNQVRAACVASGRHCRIAMDLAGPKLRTGPLEPGPRLVVCKPRRDVFGRLLTPARILFAPVMRPLEPPAGLEAVVPIRGDDWQRLKPGDVLQGVDASGRHRRLEVVKRQADGLLISSTRTCHFTPGLRFVTQAGIALSVGTIPPQPGAVTLRPGDRLRIVGGTEPGRGATLDERGAVTSPAVIGCTLPEVFADVKVGERIVFDEGRIVGTPSGPGGAPELLVEITGARRQRSRLRADKGINLPDSTLTLAALTPRDLENLAFVASHADIVNVSFLRRPDDVHALQEQLLRLGRADLGVILKIETRQAFDQLPALLLAGMRHPAPLGVMIARGDLAIECGWERLAEIQEEMLRVCEAAHLPCIWATQVLEELAQRGTPTRAEITDAAMGARAEGVLLNKGPNIAATVRTLHDIVLRMQNHQRKNSPRFRRLELAAHHHPEAVPLSPAGHARG